MNKKATFTEYLMEKCMNETHALDDMLPDVYEDWVVEQDIEDIIDWAEKWAKSTTPVNKVEPDIELKKLKEEFEERFKVWYFMQDRTSSAEGERASVWNFFAPHLRNSKELTKAYRDLQDNISDYKPDTESLWKDIGDILLYRDIYDESVLESVMKHLKPIIAPHIRESKKQAVDYIEQRLKQHRDNLKLWEDGTLVPTAQDEQEVEITKEGLRACIYELVELTKFLSTLESSEKEENE